MGVLVASSKTWLSFIVFPFGIFLSTTHYRIDVNFSDRTVFDYLWILGFKKGKKQQFNSAEYFFIGSNNVNQTHGSISIRFHTSATVYNAYLKLDDESFFLKEGFDKSEMKSFIFSLSHKYNIPYKD